MKLITHNLLASNVPKVAVSYPLILSVTKFEVEENDFEKEFIINILSRIDYAVLRKAASLTGYELPAELPFMLQEEDELLRRIHHALLNIEIVEGTLTCPSSGRQFPITQGIPNMLLTEEEL